MAGLRGALLAGVVRLDDDTVTTHGNIRSFNEWGNILR